MFTEKVLAAFDRFTSPNDAAFLQQFFKTADGGYAADDQFLGVRVPQTRIIAKQFASASLAEVEELLENPLHELRLCAVIIMTEQAKRADDTHHKELFDLYLRRSDRVNNWDIVDASCREIVGGYLLKHPEHTSILFKLAASENIWERRIAMVSTWQYIRIGQLDLTFELAQKLLSDKQDLIHKAVGWMLREAGKKDELRLRAFLAEHKHHMPRTALRYAIEKFSPEDRAQFLTK
jgi:3-methyladenine DNA glycosylase AlkD